MGQTRFGAALGLVLCACAVVWGLIDLRWNRAPLFSALLLAAGGFFLFTARQKDRALLDWRSALGFGLVLAGMMVAAFAAQVVGRDAYVWIMVASFALVALGWALLRSR